MIERFKENKFALMLFISTILLIILYLISIFSVVSQYETLVEQAKLELINNGYTDAQIAYSLRGFQATLFMTFLLSGVLLIFVALCGFKCSLGGNWRAGAIVFGLLFVLDDFSGLFDSISTLSLIINIISFVIALGYFIGAIKSVKYNHLDEPRNNYFKDDDYKPIDDYKMKSLDEEDNKQNEVKFYK